MRRYEGIYEAVGFWGWGFVWFVEGLVDHRDWVVAHFDCGGETPPPRGVGCERLQMRIFAIIPLIGEKQQGGVVNGSCGACANAVPMKSLMFASTPRSLSSIID